MPPDAAILNAAVEYRKTETAPIGLLRNLFSFRVMLAAGIVVIAVLTAGAHFNDPDLWFHLKIGQIVWDTHTIPTTDLFSHTAFGHPWVAHEWLAELSMYAAWRWGAESGVMLWFAFFGSLVFVLSYVLAYRYARNALVAFMGGVMAWGFGTVGLTLRPHLVGYSFLAAELIVLDLASRNRKWLIALPPMFAVWVNCHGSYFFGFGLLGIYWIGTFIHGAWGLFTAEAWDARGRKQLTAAMALSLLAMMANPVGFHLLLYPLNVAFQQSTGLSAVEEWMPPNMAGGRGLAMLFVMAALLAVPLLRRTEIRVRDLMLAAAAFGLALQHMRMLFVFGIVVSPILCGVIAPLLGKDDRKELPAANAFLLAVFAAVLVWSFPARTELRKQVSRSSPVAAVDFIRRQGLSGPMLNEYVFGDYLIWALPEHKVFIDGRGDVFDWTGVFPEFGRWATLSEDPNLLLDKYKIRFCLLAKGSSMVQVLPYLPSWQKVYSDDVAVVFVRTGEVAPGSRP